MKRLNLLILLLCPLLSNSQEIKSVLFIGNSYTAVNDLPFLVSEIASSLGDSLIYDSNTPGGYTFQLHSTNPTTISKINSRNWDVVVLQEQSQLPSFPYNQVLTDVYPYADSLNRIIKSNDSCSQTMFYMTWGRKNGDATNCPVWPPVCTYDGMQTLLRERYVEMGVMFDAVVATAGAAWRNTRDSLPGIELYQPDESHPSLAGSYLVACTFYASIWRKTPIGAAWPLGLDSVSALSMQTIADNIVFDSLQIWNIDTSKVSALFTYSINTSEVQLINTSVNADSSFWDFGDGSSSWTNSPTHYYSSTGVFDVMLVAFHGCETDTLIQQITISVLGSGDENAIIKLSISPNPAVDEIFIRWPQNFNPTDYSIIRLTGGSIQNGYLENRIDIAALRPGIYFIIARFNEGIFSKRFVIMR